MARKYTYIVLFLCLLQRLSAQDVHFSQFFNSPLTLSPAETGNIDGIWRAVVNYRNQWNAFPKPFNTSAASFEMPKYINNKKVGFGIGFIHDESGSLLLTADKVFISGSYEHLSMDGHMLRGGIQVGFSHKSIDSRRITLPNQYDNTIGDFNNQLSSGEYNLNEKSSYLDIHVGANWSKIYQWGKPKAGISVYHINFPKENFFSQSERLHPRMVLYASLDYQLSKNISLTPRIISMIHKRASYLNLGSEIYYELAESKVVKKQLFFGLFLRNNYSSQSDALIFDAGVVYDNVKFGLSYDINISKLNTVTNYNGAIEFALLYTFSYDKYKNYTIPCKRL